MPQPRRADIRAIVRLLQGGSAAQQTEAASALLDALESGGDAIAAAIVDAGGIPTLLQLVNGQPKHPGIRLAAAILILSAKNSPERCSRAIMAADGGVARLVRCLNSSSCPADVQVNAAGILSCIAASQGGGEAGLMAVAAASAIPAAIRCFGSSKYDLSFNAARLIVNLAAHPQLREAIVADAAALPTLTGLLRCPNQAVVGAAAQVLSNLTHGEVSMECIAALEETGSVPLLVELIAANNFPVTVEAAARTVRSMLIYGPDSVAAIIIEAGGVPAFVRCLKARQFSEAHRDDAAVCLGMLADIGVQPSRQIAASGGIRALVQALAAPCSLELKAAVAGALADLLRNGQAAAVAVADPTSSVDAALEWLHSAPPSIGDNPEALAKVAEALRLLAAARACAAPGCGATTGLKKCKGCQSVRYCGEDCMRAHWKEHRPACKRLRAEAAAAAAAGAAGPSTSAGQA